MTRGVVHAQLVDVASIQRALCELERAHLKMKQQYGAVVAESNN